MQSQGIAVARGCQSETESGRWNTSTGVQRAMCLEELGLVVGQLGETVGGFPVKPAEVFRVKA